MGTAGSILLVEDIRVVADAIRLELSTHGYSVTVARTGVEAEAILKCAKPRFTGLITDICLKAPIDGWGIARMARVRDPDIFVVYITGDDVNPADPRIVQGGLVLQKPVAAAALLLTIAKLGKNDQSPDGGLSVSQAIALYARLGFSDNANRQRTKSARAKTIHDQPLPPGELIDLIKYREESRIGQAKLKDSQDALASSQAETKNLVAELLASKRALASSQKDAKVGLIDLVASAASLATLRAETKISLAELLASATDLAASRAETQIGHTDLLASETANRALSSANDLLITNEAALERIVEQRTVELTREMEERRIAEEALRQGEKLQAIGQLTGGIAHDFNNILQIVFSTTSFLRSPQITDARRSELLDNLEEAAVLGAQVTSRLLAFARKKVLVSRYCDLNDLIQGMAELLLPTLGSNVSCDLDLSPEVTGVITDRNELEVAILNLASNARDAMQPGGGVFKLATNVAYAEATLERPAGEYVCLAVSDTGGGMPPEAVEHAFEPFFTTKPKGKGTGLGLAQVWGFAKQTGGDVAIGTSGEGTTITLFFPRPSLAALEGAKDLRDGNERTASSPLDLRRKTVLVVEDNGDLSKLTVSLLQQMGYDTISAENAYDALKLFDGKTVIDAVFSDVVMPGDMNGVELAKTLHQRYPHLPVTLATGYSEFLIENPAPGSVEVLSKPYRIGELTAAIGRSFARVNVSA